MCPNFGFAEKYGITLWHPVYSHIILHYSIHHQGPQHTSDAHEQPGVHSAGVNDVQATMQETRGSLVSVLRCAKVLWLEPRDEQEQFCVFVAVAPPPCVTHPTGAHARDSYAFGVAAPPPRSFRLEI